jgi:protocatechuate 3,4-dioxygenase beta subunit
MPALLFSASSAAKWRTPSMTEGPFFPRPVPDESDFDMVTFKGGVSPGDVIEVVGHIVDKQGMPINGAVVEMWHCDPNGVYAHVGFDTHPNFQGYGAVTSGHEGQYLFRTIRPGLYPGRARHIHFKIHGAERSLTTQVFFPGDPTNDDDGLLWRAHFFRMSEPLIARLDSGATERYVFDVVL